MALEIRIKRIYEEPSADDGWRLFADRLWARGITKKAARIDVWPKELTPSTELRKWFHADLSRFPEFAIKYARELEQRRAEIDALLTAVRDHSVLTLVTASKNIEDGHVAALRSFLSQRLLNARGLP